MFLLFKLSSIWVHNLWSSQDLSKYRLVDMYTQCTEAEVKELFLESLSNSDGNLCIVIGTLAFGVGLDCPNV